MTKVDIQKSDLKNLLDNVEAKRSARVGVNSKIGFKILKIINNFVCYLYRRLFPVSK